MNFVWNKSGRLAIVLSVCLSVFMGHLKETEASSLFPFFGTPPTNLTSQLLDTSLLQLKESDWEFSQPRCGRSLTAPSATFYLYTNGSDPSESKVIKLGDIHSLQQSGYQKDAAVWKVLIHGFLQHRDSFFPRAVKDAYLKRMITHPKTAHYNILVVDWGNRNCSSISDRVGELLAYNAYADCTTDVARQVAEMLVFLRENGAINSTFRNVHLVGFSLGAHVAGQAGRNVTDMTGDKISRITALDPAGPSFPWWEVFPKHHQDLSPLDADFVDVIHTSGFLGTGRRLGHADFHVNGGTDQPGCIADPADFVIRDFLQICSHNYAADIFAKSILDNSRKGCACGENSTWNYLKYMVGWCKCQDQAVVGEFINTRFSAGDYFVSTPRDEVNWRKYMKTLNESELNRSDSRVLALFEVLCVL